MTISSIKFSYVKKIRCKIMKADCPDTLVNVSVANKKY